MSDMNTPEWVEQLFGLVGISVPAPVQKAFSSDGPEWFIECIEFAGKVAPFVLAKYAAKQKTREFRFCEAVATSLNGQQWLGVDREYLHELSDAEFQIFEKSISQGIPGCDFGKILEEYRRLTSSDDDSPSD